MKKTTIILILLFCFNNLKAEKVWVSRYYEKYNEILGLECFNDQNCIAVIDAIGYTKVIKSTNKGETWEQIYFYDHIKTKDSIYSFHRVQILDSNNIYIAYSSRIILQHSTDGGYSFNRITFDTISAIKGDNTVDSDYILNFTMYNSNVGVILTNKLILFTLDGWKTYKVQEIGKYINCGEPMYFINENNIAINRIHVGTNDQLKFNLTDGSWTKYNDSIISPKGEYRKVMYDVTFLPNSEVGFVCGCQLYGVGDFAKDIIWKTTNRGKDWEIIFEDLYPETFALTHIYFKDSLNGITTSDFGKILVTSDGGKTWNYLKPNSILEKNSVALRGCIVDDYYLVSSFRADIWRYEEDLSSIAIDNENKLSIYPNPTHFDNIKINIEGMEYANIIIIDILGSEKLKLSNIANNSNLDISSLNNGFYLINVLINNKTYSQKLIVNR